MIDKIGIVGAGQMGGGIAHVCALAGLDVTLLDIEDAPLALPSRPSAVISPARSRGKIAEADADAAVARIATTTDYVGFARLRRGGRSGHRKRGNQTRGVRDPCCRIYAMTP